MGHSTDVQIIRLNSPFLSKYPYFAEVVDQIFRRELVLGEKCYVFFDTVEMKVEGMSYHNSLDYDFKFDVNHPEIKPLWESISESNFVDVFPEIEIEGDDETSMAYENNIDNYMVFMIEKMTKEDPNDFTELSPW